MKAYKTALRECKQICITEIANKVVNTPCSRFWVSEERATMVCSAIMQGKPILDTMRSTKREMFMEIYKRVLELQKQQPDEKIFSLVVQAVNSPAPKFYMRPRCAMQIIYNVKNGFYDKQFRR